VSRRNLSHRATTPIQPGHAPIIAVEKQLSGRLSRTFASSFGTCPAAPDQYVDKALIPVTRLLSVY
jgi:hypothetical protein